MLNRILIDWKSIIHAIPLFRCGSKTFVLIFVLRRQSSRCTCIEFILKNCSCVYSLKLCKINSLTDRIFSRRDKKKRGAIIIFLHFVCARICCTTACIRLQSVARPPQKRKKHPTAIYAFILHGTFIIVCSHNQARTHTRFSFLISIFLRQFPHCGILSITYSLFLQ